MVITMLGLPGKVAVGNGSDHHHCHSPHSAPQHVDVIFHRPWQRVLVVEQLGVLVASPLLVVDHVRLLRDRLLLDLFELLLDAGRLLLHEQGQLRNSLHQRA